MNTKQWKDKTLNSLLMERFGYGKPEVTCEQEHPGMTHEQYIQENELEEAHCGKRDDDLEEAHCGKRDDDLEEGDFPDLTGDGKVTQADILKGRGVDLEDDK